MTVASIATILVIRSQTQKNRASSTSESFGRSVDLARYRENPLSAVEDFKYVGPHLRLRLTGEELWHFIEDTPKYGYMPTFEIEAEVAGIPLETIEDQDKFLTFSQDQKSVEFSKSPLDHFLNLLVVNDINKRIEQGRSFQQDGIEEVGDQASVYFQKYSTDKAPPKTDPGMSHFETPEEENASSN